MTVPINGSWARMLGYGLEECPCPLGSAEELAWLVDYQDMDDELRSEGRRILARAEEWARRESCIGRAAPLSTRGAMLASTNFEIMRTTQ